MSDDTTPSIWVNGQPRAGAGLTVAELLVQCGYTSGRVAVELNGEILPRVLFASHVLQACDKLEIVHFVGGG